MITYEKLKNHQQALQKKHDELDKIIEQHYSMYMDDLKLKEEKLEKLKLKQEIQNIQTQLDSFESQPQ